MSYLKIELSSKEQSCWDKIPVNADLAELRDLLREKDDWSSLKIEFHTGIIDNSDTFSFCIFCRPYFEWDTFENVADIRSMIDEVKKAFDVGHS